MAVEAGIAVELAYFAIGIAIAAKEAKTERQLCVAVEVEALNFDLVDAHCGLEADRREEFELLRALDVSFEQCAIRSEEHTSELESLMRISYAVFCLKKTIKQNCFICTYIHHIMQSQQSFYL